MKIEHTAFQVEDPAAVARWYVAQLGLTIKRALPDRPFTHFLADDGDAVMIEFYNNPRASVPDYRQIDPLVLHVAFSTRDVAGVRAALIAAGATAHDDVQVTDAGDEMAMLRDPWGLAIQLVRRREPMIPGSAR